MRKHSRPTVLPIGVISEGTLRPEDLIPAYLDVLEPLRLSRNDRNALRQIRARVDRSSDAYFDSDEAGFDLESLENIAQTRTPDYCYAGSLEGDGACIGVWPVMPDAFNEDVFRSNDAPTTTKPAARQVTTNGARFRFNYAGQPYWLHITDHGNATLYRRSGRTWREVWSVV